MEKEKMIEEMAKIIDEMYNVYTTTAYDIAEGLYNACYRKVPDGAVALLIGENNQALDEKTIEYFVKHNEQIRNETAREILQCLYGECYGTQESRGGYAHITPLDILMLARQYGVEVEE